MNSSAAAVLIAAHVTATEKCARDVMRLAAKSSIALKARSAKSTTAAGQRMYISPALSVTSFHAI